MKLTVLIDNNTYIDEYYIGEPALSYYIEGALFGNGYSLRNDTCNKNTKSQA